MEILEAYDLTASFRGAAEWAGCSHHTVEHWVAAREQGRLTPGAGAAADADRRFSAEARGVGGALARAGPRGCGAREADLGSAMRVGAHHPPRGGAAQAGLSHRASAGAPPVGARAWMWMDAVRLRRRSPRAAPARALCCPMARSRSPAITPTRTAGPVRSTARVPVLRLTRPHADVAPQHTGAPRESWGVLLCVVLDPATGTPASASGRTRARTPGQQPVTRPQSTAQSGERTTSLKSPLARVRPVGGAGAWSGGRSESTIGLECRGVNHGRKQR